jgi:hypothetical protein
MINTYMQDKRLKGKLFYYVSFFFFFFFFLTFAFRLLTLHVTIVRELRLGFLLMFVCFSIGAFVDRQDMSDRERIVRRDNKRYEHYRVSR